LLRGHSTYLHEICELRLIDGARHSGTKQAANFGNMLTSRLRLARS